MESFLVYLFNFYYAISELEQNKQNNTIIFFLLFIFLTKKWTSAVCGGGGGGCGRTHRTPPSLRACSIKEVLDRQKIQKLAYPTTTKTDKQTNKQANKQTNKNQTLTNK